MPGIAMLAAIVLVTGLAEPLPVRAGEPSIMHALANGGPVTLLSYNVEGLPWPLTHGRTQAAADIAATLRNQPDRPQVVAVQEAFGDAQKGIGRQAGYRFVAYGPSAEQPRTDATTPGERAFVAAASLWHGETEAPREDSGLAIFSDYPILWARRVTFPRYACAGYDCLANKGMLAVALRIPGQTAPLIVVDTHLNSRGASGVAPGRSLFAYRAQVDALRGLLASLGAARVPLLLAGDFNVGNDPARRAYLGSALTEHGGMTIAASETVCGTDCRAVTPVASVDHAKTIVAFRGGGGSVSTEGAPRSFGTTVSGRMLSDHVGVMRTFAFGA